MCEDLFYPMERKKIGCAVIINNLDIEQVPTRKDVTSMARVLKEIGFDVEVHCNLNSQAMNSVKRKITEDKRHRESNCFLMLVISHGTGDNFLQDKDGQKTWNIESLVTEVCDIQSLVGKPKLFFIEACRGKENNFGVQMMTKSQPVVSHGISLPSKQDVFVGFATVPGFVSFTSSLGSPYLQSLSSLLSSNRRTTDLADIHLLVKRQLAAMKLGTQGARQGAEERSSLLSKLLFSKYIGNHTGSIKGDLSSNSSLSSSRLSLSSLTPLVSTPTRTTPSSSSSSRLSLNSITPLVSTSTRTTPRQIQTTSISIPITRSPITMRRGEDKLERDLKTLSMDTHPSTSPQDMIRDARATFLSSLSEATPEVRSLFMSTISSPESFSLTKPERSSIFNSPTSTSSIFNSTNAYNRPTNNNITSSPKSPLKPSSLGIRTIPIIESPLKVSSAPASPLKLTPVPDIFRSSSQIMTTTTTHEIEIASTDVEKGLQDLLAKVVDVYGGKGKVKVKKKAEEKKYSFKYLGPEKAANLLETALASVRNLQSKGDLWKFKQRILLESGSFMR